MQIWNLSGTEQFENLFFSFTNDWVGFNTIQKPCFNGLDIIKYKIDVNNTVWHPTDFDKILITKIRWWSTVIFMKKVIVIGLLNINVFYFVNFLLTSAPFSFLQLLALEILQICRYDFFIELFYYFDRILFDYFSSSSLGKWFKYY